MIAVSQNMKLVCDDLVVISWEVVLLSLFEREKRGGLRSLASPPGKPKFQRCVVVIDLGYFEN